MTGEFEAAGELATGALLGRALEPRAGEGHDDAHCMCLNCGTALIGPHCHRCGQAGHVHRSLAAMGHEILHGVFHFEGKLWRTLPMLAWRPGDLTLRYIEGERARFVSPMAIFLFSIFAMFAVFSWAGISAPTDLQGSASASAKLEDVRKDLTEQRADLIEDRGDKDTSAARRARDDQRIAEVDARLDALSKVNLSEGRTHTTFHMKSAFSGWAPLDHGIEKWNKNPSLMLYKLQSSIYKFSWLLIPLSLPFVWLLFAWKRQYKLYDHTVFITYSIAFMSLLFIAITLAAEIGIGAQWLGIAGVVIPFVHITRQLKQAYRLGWISAVLRALVLSVFITIVLTVFLVLLVLMGMMG